MDKLARLSRIARSLESEFFLHLDIYRSYVLVNTSGDSRKPREEGNVSRRPTSLTFSPLLNTIRVWKVLVNISTEDRFFWEKKKTDAVINRIYNSPAEMSREITIAQ